MKMDPIEECRVMAEHRIAMVELDSKVSAIRLRISAYKREYLSDSPYRNKGSRGQKIATPKPSAAESMKNKLRR